MADTTLRRKVRSDKSPLWLHSSGNWCKKHRGQFYYFGKDKAEALKRYRAEWDDILTGRVPQTVPLKGLTVAELVNHFLTMKEERQQAGELSHAMLRDYHFTARFVVECFGRNRSVADLRQEDFAAMRRKLSGLSPVTVNGIVTRVRTIFKYGWDAELLEKPIRFGISLPKPSKKSMRLARTSKLLKAEEIRALLDKARPDLRSWILLGINCAFGQSDISELPFPALDEREGWIVFPRPKTGIYRTTPLWPETVAALKASREDRYEPASEEDAEIVFISKYKRRQVRQKPSTRESLGYRTDGIGQEYGKLCKKLGVATGFYRLRHTFRTVADGARDQVAAGIIMGHLDDSMAGQYRESIEDERLEAVVNHVRHWLFGNTDAADAVRDLDASK